MFFRRDSRGQRGRVPMIVVLTGLNELAANGTVPDLGAFEGGDSSSCGNGTAYIRYSERHGSARVNGGEFAQCADDCTMLVLTDAKRPGEAQCVPIDAVSPPPTDKISRVGVIARIVGALLTRSKRFELPSALWLEELTTRPEIAAFLKAT